MTKYLISVFPRPSTKKHKNVTSNNTILSHDLLAGIYTSQKKKNASIWFE